MGRAHSCAFIWFVILLVKLEEVPVNISLSNIMHCFLVFVSMSMKLSQPAAINNLSLTGVFTYRSFMLNVKMTLWLS